MGRELATSKMSATVPTVVPIAMVSSAARTNPSTRETMVPAAMMAVERPARRSPSGTSSAVRAGAASGLFGAARRGAVLLLKAHPS